MKTRFRISLAIAFGLLTTAVLHWAAVLLNAPHDASFYAGVVLVLFVLVVGPTLFYKLVFPRRKKSNDSQENPSA